MTPCPLCHGTDLERFTERDTATGTNGVFNFCKTCGCCAPAGNWETYQAETREKKL